jgi:hypothetical protein
VPAATHAKKNENELNANAKGSAGVGATVVREDERGDEMIVVVVGGGDEKA